MASHMATLLGSLYGTGLRVSELVTLPLVAVERDPTMLIVRGKGDEERLVPLSDRRSAIASWLHVGRRRWPTAKARASFPSRGRTGHLTRQRFASSSKERRCRRRHRSARVSPHVLRHAFASHLLAAGGPAQRAIDAGPRRHLVTTNPYPCPGRKLRSWCRTNHPGAAPTPPPGWLTGFPVKGDI